MYDFFDLNGGCHIGPVHLAHDNVRRNEHTRGSIAECVPRRHAAALQNAQVEHRYGREGQQECIVECYIPIHGSEHRRRW